MNENDNKILKAVALKYDIGVNAAPLVIAKGKGELAKNIIKIAKENELPIKKDEDLIELLSKLDVDEQIPDNMYKAVAEIFTYIYELNKKNKDL